MVFYFCLVYLITLVAIFNAFLPVNEIVSHKKYSKRLQILRLCGELRYPSACTLCALLHHTYKIQRPELLKELGISLIKIKHDLAIN